MKICFIDCEFTDLNRPLLLSIGLVIKDGDEFYMEFDPATDEGLARRKKASDFVEDIVLTQWDLLPGATDTYWGMGRRLGEWLLGQAVKASGKIQVAYDYDADFELLGELLQNAGLWAEVRPVVQPINIDRLTGTIEGELAKEDAFESVLRSRALLQHHALADALALRAAYLAVEKTTNLIARGKSQGGAD